MVDELKKIGKILSESKTIAVVGISRDPSKTSRMIADYLIDKDYKVVGVNPFVDTIEGIEVYKSLRDIPFKIDIVDVFRRSEDIPEIIDDVIAVKPKVLWLQQGIQNDSAVQPVINAGITTFQDMCIAVYYGLSKDYQNQ